MNTVHNNESKNNYDVIIIGAGIAGTILAAILARQNVKVLVVDSGTHPRFVIGESMIPATSFMMRIMAERYDVPEIMHCSTLPFIQKNITSNSGIKRNFSFIYHREGQAQNPNETTQLPVPNIPYGPEAHLMRQDTDAYMMAVAIKYGADIKQKTFITDIDINDEGAWIKTSVNDEFHAKFIVDASGVNSVLSKRLGLREEPTRMKTNTRSIFTHMIGVKPYDEICKKSEHNLPSPLHNGTLHHIFDGGWLWVIPFDNTENSTSKLCSVGLQFDLTKTPPKTDKEPEQEFSEFLSRFPEVAKQFEDAKPVREWISSNRLQYSASEVVGDRFCLLAHASAFIDPLFSRGLAITTETINSLAQRLIDSVNEDHFYKERFEPVAEIIQNSYDTNDRLVACSYAAFKDFDLWNAWYRIWALGQAFTSLRFTQILSKYYKENNIEHLLAIEKAPYIGSLCVDLDEFQPLFEKVASTVEEVRDNHLPIDEAVKRIYGYYSELDFLPEQYDLTNPDRHYIGKMNLIALYDIVTWGAQNAPEKIRKLYFDFDGSFLSGNKEVAAELE
ncbi:NAD(P)/FAD-dependent oxidoreductase [Paenibacillus sp. IHBB 10380]|uniref:NAD(P)/FAD-dependent oxidoreductase n=1 Tax=Paenibacillus sp. IHBB 10380 TaxID=1566358 RepID=UPI0005CFD6DD|nr:NAD(P)/FAD-dependent oxidoreductase [Paenibacillus sp. IHBB 10380]AJS60192.1 FAD-dependent oxidoreductase [Paenibacillus sp. IHBB 10380]